MLLLLLLLPLFVMIGGGGGGCGGCCCGSCSNGRVRQGLDVRMVRYKWLDHGSVGKTRGNCG